MIWVVLILELVILLVLMVYFIAWVTGLIFARGVPFIPLTKRELEAVSRCVKLEADDRIVDLGCGDGRVLRMFEKQGANDLTGYEINFWAYLLAKIKNKFLKSKAKIYFKNFRKVDLSEYSVVFCYLMDYYVNFPFFREKFDRELKPGTKIISFAFEIKNWHKPEIIYVNNKNKKSGRVFIYKI